MRMLISQSPVMGHLQEHEPTHQASSASSSAPRAAPDGPPGVAGERVPSAEERLAASELDRAAREQHLRDWQADLEARESRLQEREATERARQDEQEPREASARRDAIRALDEAERAAGGGEALGEARRFLEEGEPCAKRAAKALMAIAGLANIKAAERALRDVVVLRCSSQAAPGDRNAFLEAAAEAFGRTLDREVRAVLLLSYHKVFKGSNNAFLSNSARRGRTRPRRQRAANGDAAAGPAQEEGGAVIIVIIMIIMMIMIIIIIIRQRGDARGLLEPGSFRPRRRSGARGRAFWRRGRRARVDGGAPLCPAA